CVPSDRQRLSNSTTHFRSLPKLHLINLEQVKAIFVSDAGSLLGLPYVTEYTNFKGQIYATEPVIALGKLQLKELVSRRERDMLLYNDAVYPCYNPDDVRSCLSKITAVRYNEIVVGSTTTFFKRFDY
ncbi:Integrator complex subunit 9, partial [Chytridiales sp. JEL 0842]